MVLDSTGSRFIVLPQQPFHHTINLIQRRIQCSGIFAAGFGQIGPPSAFAANLLRNRANHFASLNAAESDLW